MRVGDGVRHNRVSSRVASGVGTLKKRHHKEEADILIFRGADAVQAHRAWVFHYMGPVGFTIGFRSSDSEAIQKSLQTLPNDFDGVSTFLHDKSR